MISYQDDAITILQGNALDELRGLPDESIHCCVTSPPYWGLRDYGVAGQIGMEKTPEEYVARLVEVFREVKRVLRKDGVVFLNMGDSYAGSWSNYHPNSPQGKHGQRVKETARWNRPAYSSQEFLLPTANVIRRFQRGRPCDTDGKEQLNSRDSGSFYSHLCDECRDALGSSRSSGISQPASESQPTGEKKVHDTGHLVSGGATSVVEHDAERVSTTPESSSPLLAECSHCDNCGACLSVLRSSSRDGSLCAHRAAYKNGKTGLWSGDHILRKDASGMAWLNISQLKAKDLVGIPFLLAFALRADGWYLRSDIIWAKPNGMPESVGDRPTRSHEYVFLLSRSERYYFNADAVRTPPRTGTILRLQQPSLDRQQGSLRANGETRTDRPMKAKLPKRDKQRGHGCRHEGFNQRWDSMTKEEQQMNGANLRDVWWISPMPFKEAHFATFPPELIQPCILAGCVPGGTVLDPFLGSGTTSMVAEALSCKSIGIELNPKYIKIALRRLKQKGLFLG